jgi:hypothetical protein
MVEVPPGLRAAKRDVEVGGRMSVGDARDAHYRNLLSLPV